MTDTWRYYVKKGKDGSWGVFFLDSTGVFSCVTDHGNYGYLWPCIGEQYTDVRYFLLDTDEDYVCGKLNFGKKKVYDGEATYKNIKQHLEDSKEDLGSKYKDEVMLLEEHEEMTDSESSLALWANETELCDWAELVEYDIDHELKGFMKYMWPRFVEMLKKELGK